METEIVQNAVCLPPSPDQTAPSWISTLATGARTCITKTGAERSMSTKTSGTIGRVNLKSKGNMNKRNDTNRGQERKSK
uniref:Putative ovule protein n=1 Tax=Solanum chacoense TaxID=4108 RepID=A0A0V0GUH1_SOLCH